MHTPFHDYITPIKEKQNVKLPRNRPRRPIGVFPVRYDYHLHIKSKAILVTGLRGP
jgi:hypothetical protein